jgi:hypothetical protein
MQDAVRHIVVTNIHRPGQTATPEKERSDPVILKDLQKLA